MKHFILILIILSFALHLQAQWVQTDAAYGCSISALTTHGENIFLSTSSNGLFRSTDDHKSWIQLDQFAHASGLVFFDSILFAGMFNGGVYAYSYLNDKWAITNISLSDKHIYSLTLIDTILFAGTFQTGLFRSTDKGATWEITSGDIPSTTTGFRMLKCGDKIFAGTSTYGIFCSEDYGVSWYLVDVGATVPPVTDFLATANNIFAASPGLGVLRSTDNGETWNTVNTGLENVNVNCLTLNDTTIIAATTNEIYRSWDEGEHWEKIASNLPLGVIVNLKTFGSSIIAGSLDNGVFISADDGISWKSLNKGLPVSTVSSFTNTSVAFYAGSLSHKFFRSTDKGLHWETRGIALAVSMAKDITSLTARETKLFLGTTDYWVFQYREDDGPGSGWGSFGGGLPSNHVNSLTIHDNIIFAATDSGVARAVIPPNYWDFALWDPINIGLTDSIANTLIVVPENGNKYNIFAGTNSGVFLSTNDGDLWTSASYGLTSTKILSFTYTKDAANKTTLFAGTEDGGVFRTTDNGSNWISASAGLEGKYVRALTSYKKNNVNYLVAGTEIGVFASVNSGDSWANISAGLADVDIYSVAAFDVNLFVGTYGEGIWRKPISEIVLDVPEEPSLPETFSLEQNYPNPFNPSTTIEYKLPKNGYVSVKVYNILGQEVSTLVDEVKTAGRYSVAFNGNNFSSGIYFCTLTTISFSASKKMLLTK